MKKLCFVCLPLWIAACHRPATPPIVTAAVIPTGEAFLLSGSAIPQGRARIVDYRWSQVAGPRAIALADPNHSSTSIFAPGAGTYVFELFATDSRGLTGTAYDTVQARPTGLLSFR